MFENVQHIMVKHSKNKDFVNGTTFATATTMKRTLSIQYLLLLAGVVVALIVAFTLFNQPSKNTSEAQYGIFPKLSIPAHAKGVVKKIILLF
jgi:hypothetical protein